MQTLYATLFSAATSLNAFWIINLAKESLPDVKALLNFYPVTGPLLGLYAASVVVLIAAFIAARILPWFKEQRAGAFLSWYFVFSVVVFFFAVFPLVYEPIVELLR